ncbi:MAG: HPr family phosphocarrier protein, partial [Sinobacteraceae bacterium]|nr:HPr family phosphocarrier protein [Nevskiaceae bacterium]
MSDSVPSALILRAPLRGWSTPLEEAPDPVFAARMLGDGIAIDPTGDTLYAPCDAIVTAAPPSKHAVSLRAPNGAELLLHVGIDTVALGGVGFELFVAVDDQVRTGDRLLSFDLDLLAQRARSVLTPVIVTNSERFTLQPLAVNRAIQVGDPWLELAARHEGAAPSAARPEPDLMRPGTVAAGAVITRQVAVLLEHGIHARPAGLMAKALKTLAAEVEILWQQRRANAKSPIALMALGVRHGDVIKVAASGADAVAAVNAIEALLRAPQSAAVTRPPARTSDTVLGPAGGNPAAGNSSPAVDNSRSAAGNKRPAADNNRPAADNNRPAA